MQLVLCNAALRQKSKITEADSYAHTYTATWKGLTRRSNACRRHIHVRFFQQEPAEMTLYFAKLGFDQPCIGRYSAVPNRTTTEGEAHACALTCKGGMLRQGERDGICNDVWHAISSWVVNAWYSMSIPLVNSRIIWIFHWGQLLACLLINLIARVSCSSVSWRVCAPTVLAGLLQGEKHQVCTKLQRWVWEYYRDWVKHPRSFEKCTQNFILQAKSVESSERRKLVDGAALMRKTIKAQTATILGLHKVTALPQTAIVWS